MREQLLGPNGTDLHTQDTMDDLNQQPIALTIETRLKRCGGEMRLVIPPRLADRVPVNAVPALIKAISRAHEWIRLIVAGEYKNQRAIAAAIGLPERYVRRIIQGAFLAPEIVEAIVKGRQNPELTLATLLDKVPLSWAEQNAIITMDQTALIVPLYGAGTQTLATCRLPVTNRRHAKRNIAATIIKPWE